MAASSSTPIHLMVSEKNGSGQQPNRNNYNGVNGDDLGELVERTDSTTSSSSSWDLLQSDSQVFLIQFNHVRSNIVITYILVTCIMQKCRDSNMKSF